MKKILNQLSNKKSIYEEEMKLVVIIFFFHKNLSIFCVLVVIHIKISLIISLDNHHFRFLSHSFINFLDFSFHKAYMDNVFILYKYAVYIFFP